MPDISKDTTYYGCIIDSYLDYDTACKHISSGPSRSESSSICRVSSVTVQPEDDANVCLTSQ